MTPSHVKYDRSDTAWEECLNDPHRINVAKTWIAKNNTIDMWRAGLYRSIIRPIVDFDPNLSWVTIGDGRYGTDANALIEMGAKNVHCTDVSEKLIKIGQEIGFINSYSVENAENLSFEDNSFDFVYCKEALHHMPRPFIALDQMFRVARLGVIISEPRDAEIDRGNFHFILTLLKKLYGRNLQQHNFEPVGNYMYNMSKRELEKFLLGMHYNLMATNSFNDHHIPGVEFADLSENNKKTRKLFSKVKRRIFLLNILNKLSIRKPSALSAVLFKQEPSRQLVKALTSNGWKMKKLPANPYL